MQQKHIFNFILIIILSISCRTTAQNFVWAKSFGSAGSGIFSQSYDWAQEMVTDPSGNVIVAGGFNNTVDFDPGIGVTNLTSAGGRDIFIAKFNTNGGLIWAKRIGNTTDNDNISDLKCDANGNIFYIGQFTGTVDFDPGASTSNLVSNGGSDMFFSCLDPNGNMLGTPFKIGSTSTDYGVALTIDNAGSVYVTGAFTGTVDFDISASTYNLTSHGLQDIFVFKYNNIATSPSFVWASIMGGANSESPSDIELNTAQNYLYMVCAYTASITNGVTSFTAAGASDVYMQRIPAATGGLNLAKSFGGTDNDGVTDLAIDALDNLYLTGSFAGACDFDPSPGVSQLIVQTANDNDGYISKLNSNFVFSWVQHIESTSSDGGTKIILDSDKNILLEGFFTGPDVDLDLSAAGTYTVSNIGGTNVDGLLIKMDPAGNFVWGKNWGNSSGVNAEGFALDAHNNIFICGDYFGTCDFDPSPTSTYSLTANLYGSDAYMFKLSCTPPSTVTTTSNITPLCMGSSATRTIALASTPELGVTYSWGTLGSSGISFSPTTGTATTISYSPTTTFSIVVTATNVCGTSTTMVQSVTPYSLPSISISIVPSPTICYGDPAAFTASGASTYTWNPSYILNGMPTVHTSGGIFTVTATDANSCVNTKTVNFTVINTPSISITGKNLVCLNKPNTLAASGASTYTWLPGSVTGSTINAQPSGNTVYTVNAQDSYGCNASKTFSLNLVTPVTPSICVVTVDSLSQFNHIIWDKTPYNNVDSFIVYREVSTGTYRRIGSLHQSAYSEFIDTARSIGPANGNPNITSYRYKLQLRDSCGNYSAMSAYHNSIYFISNSTGTYFWNTYDVEGAANTPVSTFNLIRDNTASGTWTVVGSASGTQTSLNDPAYASYPNGVWRVEALGFNCSASFKLSPNAQINKSKSNVKNNFNIPLGMNTINLDKLISIAPNPATTEITISFNEDISIKTTITITDVLGKAINSTELYEGKKAVMPVNELTDGFYFIRIQQGNSIAIKKLVKH
ncbi:MAG: T9SS type A sorting domain-containing protein [Bacteroidetes bacterium]|nr:T9SS type A sorting domain-containing protein [Bacteroidota bacterium]